MVKADRCRILLESLTENYSDDLSKFLRMHPAQSKFDFDRQDLVYRMQATQRLVKADKEEHDPSSQAMKANIIARDHDFVRDAADEKYERPLPDTALTAKALRFQSRCAAIEEWLSKIDRTPRSLREGGVDEEPGATKWKFQEVALQDMDRASDVSFAPEQIRLAGKLLSKYKQDCADMRNGFFSLSGLWRTVRETARLLPHIVMLGILWYPQSLRSPCVTHPIMPECATGNAISGRVHCKSFSGALSLSAYDHPRILVNVANWVPVLDLVAAT
ncbi:hypothetical protein LTR37_011896 [Vermiconidia calcicola]|uniref:Uncharacterized protein n=1 Tax=Vermiconidia calcicola TaxID=1690605 RepID=A0ACC3N0K4_9PEZI|nr:hypothetical protein LTR37_011896 [Vermiconidia calcicola]